MVNNVAEVLASIDRLAYADSVGYIRVKEKRDLLNRPRLQEYLSLEADEILDKLRQDLHREGTAFEFSIEGLIGETIAQEYDEVARFDHHNMVIPILRYRNDIHNLKALIRKKLTGPPVMFSPVAGIHDVKNIEDAVTTGRKIDWPDPIDSVFNSVMDQSEVLPVGEWIDLNLDLAWLEYSFKATSRLRMPLLSRYFKCLSDFAVIKYLWRKSLSYSQKHDGIEITLKTYFLDESIIKSSDRVRIADALAGSVYGNVLREGLAEWRSTGSWMTMERDMDNFLVAEITGAKYISMGPEPLAAYLLAKENDLKNIRLIHVLKKAGFIEDIIKKFLRRLYV